MITAVVLVLLAGTVLVVQQIVQLVLQASSVQVDQQLLNALASVLLANTATLALVIVKCAPLDSTSLLWVECHAADALLVSTKPTMAKQPACSVLPATFKSLPGWKCVRHVLLEGINQKQGKQYV